MILNYVDKMCRQNDDSENQYLFCIFSKIWNNVIHEIHDEQFLSWIQWLNCDTVKLDFPSFQRLLVQILNKLRNIQCKLNPLRHTIQWIELKWQVISDMRAHTYHVSFTQPILTEWGIWNIFHLVSVFCVEKTKVDNMSTKPQRLSQGRQNQY